MRILWITLFSGLLLSAPPWQTDFEKAKQSAQTEHKLILLNFSGSDWCGPCIRMHKEIFESNSFKQYAGEHLELVNADFPRLRKHELSKDQQKKNDQLADTYNRDGIFPLTLLLTSEGKVLRKWEGFPQVSCDEFTGQVKAFADAIK
jgi:thioredoxin-related protein